jgi:hypothetical protein
LSIMLRSGPLVTGLLLLAVALAGCSGADHDVVETAAAYEPPAGAPDFCTRLAGAAHVDDIPAAVGAIAADARTAEARADLTAAIGELRDVLGAVRDDGGYPRLDSALDDLVAGLIVTSSGPLSEGTQLAISSNLDAVGRQAQTACEFPR